MGYMQPEILPCIPKHLWKYVQNLKAFFITREIPCIMYLYAKLNRILFDNGSQEFRKKIAISKFISINKFVHVRCK
jgi:hypothetical protein